MSRVFLWAAVALMWLGVAGARAEEALPFYPLVQGLSWTYAGTVRWSDSGAEHAAAITWKSEIVGVVRHADLVAARFRGMPFDLSDYRPGLKAEDSIVAHVQGRGFFLASGPAVPRLWREIRQGQDSGYIQKHDEFAPLFPWPLRPTEPTVGTPRSFDVSHISGSPLKRGDKATAYPVAFATGKEQTTFSFVPRLGIVSYEDTTGPVQASVHLVRISWEKLGD